ncbi:MAG: AMP-binding protein [Burkholderiaceae bacterium]
MTSPITDYQQACASHALTIPEFYNFGFDCIDVWAQDEQRLAFIALDAKGNETARHSFAQLRDDSNRVANALLDLGAEPGDLAFVMIPRVPAWYQVMVGCCKAGVVAMPGTNLLMPKDIAYRINRAGARIAIVTAQAAERVDEIRKECPSLRLLIVVGGGQRDGWESYEGLLADAATRFDRNRVPRSRSDDLMLIYFTSGTTAMPKMVPRDHGYALAHAITGRYWMDLREGEVHWTLSDTGWAKAAWGLLYGPWQMGAVNVLIDAAGFDAELHLRLISRLDVKTFCAPPTVYRMFAQLDLGAFELRGLRHSMSAGEPLNPEVIKIWQQATGGLIYDGYGQTETINIVGNYPFMAVRPGSMGRPVPGVVVDVVDDAGHRVADDEIGHIAVKITDPYPAGLFRGYWQDDEATAKVFHDGWYYTGDTATRDADGYFWFVGRSDDIISSAGYRISPFEVESTLLEHPAVAESAVVGVPDDLRGQIVKAYVVLAAGFTPADELAVDIQEFVKANTAPYKYPREIEFRDALPKTISGKIQRVQLRSESDG